MKLNNLTPALGLWVGLNVLFFVAGMIWPDARTALGTHHYTIGIVLGTLIAFWAGQMVGKKNYTDAVIAGIAVGLANGIPAVILFGYGWGMLSPTQAFSAIIGIVSIGGAVVGNMWK